MLLISIVSSSWDTGFLTLFMLPARVYLILSFYFLSIIGLTSCSKTSDPDNNSGIIGSWSGTIIQPVFGELITKFNINNTTLNGQSGSGSFKSGDISECDDSQFNCGPLACTFNLSLFSKTGSDFYELDQILIETNSTCGDGIFEVTSIDQNTIEVVWYEEPFPENRATGTLTRQ
mgnify:CR=1 FL=1